VFALVGDAEQAGGLAQSLRRHFGLGHDAVLITGARNEGATLLPGANHQPSEAASPV
jgi:hypothetical protein